MSLVSYAQNQEDIVLYRALRDIDNGFYIDVGAQHPVVDSVTKLFYERGWRGINIDPVPQWFALLCKDRPHDVNLRVAAGSVAGREKFYAVAGTGLSTADATLVGQYAEVGYTAEELEVETRTLDNICAEHQVNTVHFLKVDVEGAEEDVLRGFAFKQIRPWVVLVEAVAPIAMREGDDAHAAVETHAGWEPILIGHGYQHVYSDGLNRFYVAKEHEELKALLSTPPNPLDAFVRHEELLKHERILQLDAQVRELTEVAQVVDQRYQARDFQGLAETAENRLQRIAELEQDNARLIGQMSVMQQDAKELRDARDRIALLVQQNADLSNQAVDQRYQVKDFLGLVETAANRLHRIAELEQDNARLIGEASVLQQGVAELKDVHGRVALLVQQNVDLSGMVEHAEQSIVKLHERVEELEVTNAQLTELLSASESSVNELSAARIAVTELGMQNAILGDRVSVLERNEHELESVRQDIAGLARTIQCYKDEISSTVTSAISFATSDADRLRRELAEQNVRLADLHGELDRSQATLQQMLNSRSWQFTALFRSLRSGVRSPAEIVTSPPVARSHGKSLPRRMAHHFLMASIRFAERHPRVHAWAQTVYRRIPIVDRHLSAFVQHNFVQAKPGASVASVPPDPVPIGTDLDMPPEVVEVHQRIRRVIADQQHQKD